LPIWDAARGIFSTTNQRCKLPHKAQTTYKNWIQISRILNYVKFPTGGWFTLLVACVFSFVQIVWAIGYAYWTFVRETENLMPFESFHSAIAPSIHRIAGTGVFISSIPQDSTYIGVSKFVHQFMADTGCMYEKVLFVIIKKYNFPQIQDEIRYLFQKHDNDS
jgi:K+ transporter